MIPPPTVYTIRDLVKTYKSGKVRANDGLSFDIGQGEIFGLLGPNGAGKTTLVGQLTGLLRPDSGTLLLYGHDISRARHPGPVPLQPRQHLPRHGATRLAPR